MRSSGIFLTLSATALIVASAVNAADMFASPVVEGPIPITEESHIFNGARWQVEPIDLNGYGYTEEEFLISGKANVYDWKPGGDYKAVVKNEGKYVTRVTVRKPKDMSKFSGRVVVEIINPTALYDWTAMWAALWERLVANGDVYVGITSKPAVFPGMIKFDKNRYGRLQFENPVPVERQTCGLLPGDKGFTPNLSKQQENGLAWDIFTQVGSTLRKDGNAFGVTARWLYLTGESQSGNYAITYYKYFHPQAHYDYKGKKRSIYDGYLLESAVSPLGAPINQCATPLPDDDKQNAIPGRAAPIMLINSQWDFFPYRNRNPKPDGDSPDDRSRTWELAGANHGWRWQYLYGDADHKDLGKAGMLEGGEWNAWKCSADRIEVPLYMAEKAMYEQLIRWAEQGISPPRTEPIALKKGSFEIVYEDGTAKGGLRLPMVDVPVNSFGEGHATLSDGCPELVPFEPAKLKKMYGSSGEYQTKYSEATWSLIQQGYLLAEDASKLMDWAKAIKF